ncbi:TetR/AcrR family transcriptional regulator [Rothia sp. AR01]|uniref:TetR/AcrR family transcriptional regulator n=1 Tax=Rothia santali TaxID=2949643 RepID=A0A9X2HI71_9MICC|nr:TetR/AcrR family transcriptional regulator [Rothia santali]MCP3426166.1 TetR/AcrR family transcriptional regulator [Rothia santali]
MSTTRSPGEAQRTQIIQHTRQYFARHGYYQATMDDLARACALSKPMVYRHFESKYELYVAVVEDSARELQSRIHPLLHDQTDLHHVINRLVDEFVVLLMHRPEIHTIIFASDMRGDAVIRGKLEELHRSLVEPLGRLLVEHAHPGDEASAILRAEAIIGTVWAGARMIARTPSAEDQEALRKIIDATVWEGAFTHPRETGCLG